MRVPDIVGPSYFFWPVMLMMFAFALVVNAPDLGQALLRLVIWLVAFVIVCGVPFVVAYRLGHLKFE
jgi:cell division protein FtsW (lipid II flippase)